ncbi:hypothetical protein [Candidatus Clostridium radicumherbarum]|uniref:Transposase n=1 Tax=Candidatus Clostridium radicumherbarum TaxID=3381662 RepID=A0ABW8TQM7_9CLOT
MKDFEPFGENLLVAQPKKFGNFKKQVEIHFKALYDEFRHRCTLLKRR